MLNQQLLNILSSNTTKIAILIDPDKYSTESLTKLLEKTEELNLPDLFFVGGSLIFSDVSDIIKIIKERTNKPVYIFPGSHIHFSPLADGILFNSLISGRNPEFLIGNHVLSAPKLKESKIDIVPVGYILIDCGTNTSVSYISNTNPIPYEKTDIAIATSLAGEMLRLKCIYLEGGSGSAKTISTEMIEKVKENISIPLIVGGGIKTKEQFSLIANAGADLIVIGNILEKQPDFINSLAELIPHK